MLTGSQGNPLLSYFTLKGESSSVAKKLNYDGNRQVFYNDVNWLSDFPNLPVIGYEYTFETYPGDFWSDQKSPG